MNIDEIKRIKDERPFRPFQIRTADGREITIGHPDAIAWEGPSFAPMLFCVLPGGRREVVNVGLITSLGIPGEGGTSAAAESKAEGNGA
jgi:hypothetical protein